MAQYTDTLHLKLGRVATGTMTPGSANLTSLGFTALPWEGSGTTLMPSDVGTQVTVIGAGANIPFTPAFGPLGKMLVSHLATYSSATSGVLADAASNDTEPGAANVTVYRPISFKAGSLRIEYSLTSLARSTMSFVLESRDGSMVALEGMPILVYDDDLVDVRWGGSIDSVEIINETAIPGDMLTFKCDCISWAYLLDRRKINPYVLNGGIFTAMSLHDIAEHLIYDYCDSEGLEVTSTTGPTIDLNVSGMGDKTIGQALDAAMSKSNDATHTYVWYPDPWRGIHIVEAKTTAAAWHISDLDGTEKDVLVKINYKRTRGKLSNAVYLVCSNTLAPAVADPPTFVGNGSARDFTVTKPIGVTPTITVNSVSKTVGLANGGVVYDWYWSPGSTTVSQDLGSTVLTGGDTLVVTYQPTSTQLFTANNSTSVDRQLAYESGTGFWYSQIQWDGPVNEADGAALAQSFADQLADIPKEFTINTLKSGLDIGHTINITLAQFVIAAFPALIDSVIITTDDDFVHWEIHCVNGPPIGDFIPAFAVMAGSGSSGSGGFGGGGGGGGGGISPDIVVVITTDTTLTGVPQIVEIDTTIATHTATLPAASVMIGQRISLYRNSAANAGIVDGAGSETIDGALTLTLSDPWSATILEAVNTAATNWAVIASAVSVAPSGPTAPGAFTIGSAKAEWVQVLAS